MQSIGNSLGLGVKQVCGGIIDSCWVENRTSFAFSGPISRNHVVLELCGMHFSISVQIEYAMFGRDQGVGAGRFEQDHAGVSAACKNELATSSDGAGRDAGMATSSASCGDRVRFEERAIFVLSRSLISPLCFVPSW